MHKRQWFPLAALGALGALSVACGGGEGSDEGKSAAMRPAPRGPTQAPDKTTPVIGGRPMLAPAVVITPPTASSACLPGRPCINGVNPAALPGAMPPVAPVGAAGAAAALPDAFAVERQACVDYINMYRASAGVPPLRRATAEQEACTDAASKKDGDSGQQYSSYADCAHLGLTSQNTCPNWPVDPGSTLTASMQGCFDMMWAEGAPPQGVDACIADTTGCYPMHGHWITMMTQQATTVACGFYQLPNGTYWMNQNFGQ